MREKKRSHNLKLLNIAGLIMCSLLSIACQRSEFANGLPSELTSYLGPSKVSQDNSWVKVTEHNVADGLIPAIVTIALKDQNNNGVAGITPKLNVTSNDTTIMPCSVTDADGISRCKIYSAVSGTKSITVEASSITLWTEINFYKLQHSKSSFAIVSSGISAVAPSGQRLIASAGIIESGTIIYDANNVARVKTSIIHLLTETK